MRALVHHGKQQPEVRAQALALTRDLLQKDYEQEARRVHKFVRDEIRYVKDPRGVETVHTAPRLLEQRQGDCDDKTILAASLLEALGHTTRIVAVGIGKRFFHVLPEVQIRGQWYPLECTELWAFGRGPHPKLTRMVIDV